MTVKEVLTMLYCPEEVGIAWNGDLVSFNFRNAIEVEAWGDFAVGGKLRHEGVQFRAGACRYTFEEGGGPMKIMLKRGGTVFEAERDPMPPERFKIVCAVLLAVLYAAVVIVTVALSGVECFS